LDDYNTYLLKNIEVDCEIQNLEGYWLKNTGTKDNITYFYGDYYKKLYKWNPNNEMMEDVKIKDFEYKLSYEIIKSSEIFKKDSF